MADTFERINLLGWHVGRQLWRRPLCIEKGMLRAKTSIYIPLREMTKCA